MTWDEHTPATFAVTDIAGYNYKPLNYEPDHERFPERIMYASESHAKDAFLYWEKVMKFPWVIGDYVWTGMDYMGESGIGVSKYVAGEEGMVHPQPWPWYNAHCGDIDLIGNKKPQSYYRDVVWRESHLEILVHEPKPAGRSEITSQWGWPREEPHWNWSSAEGDSLDVNVYTSYPRVELYLNGKSVGKTLIDPSKGITAAFRVSYQPGELKAVARGRDGDPESKSLFTTGSVSRLHLAAGQTTLRASHQEIVFIHVTAIDHKNRLVPNAALPVRVAVKGQGTLLAAGNGSPYLEGSIQDNEFHLYRGQGLIILRSNGEPGNITLSASSENGFSDTINLMAGKQHEP
jgi:beta-galactosidase